MTSKTFAVFPQYPQLVLAALLVACGGQRMSVGTNDDDDAAPAVPQHCAGFDPTGDLDVRTQDEIDGLIGCEIFDGSLEIGRFYDGTEPPSLAPLASLRVVTGSLELQNIPSLHGLEALEQVGDLMLQGIGDLDLTALSNLERVIWDPPGGGDGGVISITDCAALQSLAGLETLTSWNSLSITNAPELATLVGLAGPPKLRNLWLDSLPSLRDLRGLQFVREVDYTTLQLTGIASLVGLSLANTLSLQIHMNSELTDLRALQHLFGADDLDISDNPKLNSVELGSLSRVDRIKITGNDSLTKILAYGAGESSGYSVGNDGKFVPISRGWFEVGNNAQLQDISGPDGFAQVQQVSIWGNPALTRLNLNHLERTDGLQILDNPALTTLIVPQLERVGDLDVRNNPQLSTATFDDVLTFTRTMSGNGDPVAPATPPAP